MRSGREVDIKIAEEVFGHEVFVKNRILHERTQKEDRPLHPYSKGMTWAWEVADKMKISLVPVEGDQWFAFAASNDGWETLETFLNFLRSGDFDRCGAAISTNPAEAICKAALVVIEKQLISNHSNLTPSVPESPTIN